ncbi:DNA-directed RNA polymerase subunit E'' [Candidatus Woesearchaeota archaeon]|nr:DNA-directed RNA polymerase subunit E'' [Candidatus Woesearchaeota archaeon]
MSKKKVCKKCKMFVESGDCPLCKGNQFTMSFQGRLNILDAKNSIISKKIGLDKEGEYAIKVR